MSRIDEIKAAADGAIQDFWPYLDWFEYDGFPEPDVTADVELTKRQARVRLRVKLARVEDDEVEETHVFPIDDDPQEIRRAILARLVEIERAHWRETPPDFAGRIRLERMIGMFDHTPARRILRGL